MSSLLRARPPVSAMMSLDVCAQTRPGRLGTPARHQVLNAIQITFAPNSRQLAARGARVSFLQPFVKSWAAGQETPKLLRGERWQKDAVIVLPRESHANESPTDSLLPKQSKDHVLRQAAWSKCKHDASVPLFIPRTWLLACSLHHSGILAARLPCYRWLLNVAQRWHTRSSRPHCRDIHYSVKLLGRRFPQFTFGKLLQLDTESLEVSLQSAVLH